MESKPAGTPVPFCTCPDTKCPNHPSNHDKGCTPCIAKNLAQREIPGCFVFFGSGKGADDPDLHNAKYDFNDDILEVGAGFFAQIVRDRLK